MMALRSGHGTGAGQPRVEVLPADELPAPSSGVLAAASGPLPRRHNGTVAGTEAARALGRLGGRARARSLRLVDSLGLAAIAADSAFAPYRTAAEAFVEQHLAELSRQAGGRVGPAPSSMVASAALQLASSRFAFDQFATTGEAAWIKLGSSLANDSRQNLLAAYELAVREATAREQQNDPLWKWRAQAERVAAEEATEQ